MRGRHLNKKPMCSTPTQRVRGKHSDCVCLEKELVDMKMGIYCKYKSNVFLQFKYCYVWIRNEIQTKFCICDLKSETKLRLKGYTINLLKSFKLSYEKNTMIWRYLSCVLLHLLCYRTQAEYFHQSWAIMKPHVVRGMMLSDCGFLGYI